ncbi:DHHC palmitoyltransferase-domain-containing protein, partial [Gamsiella multidivaricata]|uniref:DHHC palmitoyltransferase-domain-containing protein n=1 Tax=Gamsiella multidivaricata TaxID=101098 RepID=UPI002220E013
MYIYYIYAAHVCVGYLLKIKRDILRASIYLAAFTTFILLFFVSYALSIYCGPGSPSNPPVRVPSQPIPLLTTPYQAIPDPDPSSLPSSGHASAMPRSRSASSSTGSGQSRQHASSQAASVVIMPKYPTAPVAPIAQGPVMYLSPSTGDLVGHGDIHGVITIPSRSATQGNIDNSSSRAGPTSDRGRVSIDISDLALESCQASNGDDTSRPIATLSVSKRNGRPRWCSVCRIVKPDRCHHCSECNSCVLRMDHHCPWINGCIGFGNYKYFYLFIFYGSVSSIWVIASMVPLLVQ